MKFLVDEMPFWESDCVFFDQYPGTCKLDGQCCEYMDHPAGDRDACDCRWLRVVGA